MLSLPSKPWMKVKLEPLGEDQYRITFISPIEEEAQFLAVIEADIAASLGQGDRLEKPDWPSRSVTLLTADLPSFNRKLVFASIMIEMP